VDWQAAPLEPRSALWLGRAPARSSGGKAGASVAAIIGGTATATSMRAAGGGIAFPTDIAIELICVYQLDCRREQRLRSVLARRGSINASRGGQLALRAAVLHSPL
jgi:hypothetical protein